MKEGRFLFQTTISVRMANKTSLKLGQLTRWVLETAPNNALAGGQLKIQQTGPLHSHCSLRCAGQCSHAYSSGLERYTPGVTPMRTTSGAWG